MKKFFVFLITIIIFLVGIGLHYNINKNDSNLTNADYLRIHIRANSNDEVDQQVKYKIKDEFVNFLTPKLSNCETKQDVVDLIICEKNNLENLADDMLANNGFEYKSKVLVRQEMFPTRDYDGYTLQSGVYDALIVELGKAEGNNWWCVIYPPLCFTNFSAQNSHNVVYKSKIVEIIKKFFS